MEQIEQEMTEEEFEFAVAAHGIDLANWPDGLQQAARGFIATAEGKLVYENAKKLDQHMMLMQAGLRDQDSDGDAFLAQLKFIPAQFEQQHRTTTAGGESGWRINSLIDRLFEPARLWSPAGLVSQGAFAAALLFAGLMVGANAAGTESYEDYDISAGLFESNYQEYSIDG